MPKYNKEQQAAIDLRGKTILVSAPAGSGKTRILVARLISLIVNDHYSMDHFRDSSGFVYLCFSDVREDYTY